MGTYNHLSDSLHQYISNANKFSLSTQNKIPVNNDNLHLPKKQSDVLFKMLFNKMHKMKNSDISKEDFIKIFKYSVQNQAIHNILLVIGADAARRKKWYQLSTSLMTDCTNALFQELWNRWNKRNKVTA